MRAGEERRRRLLPDVAVGDHRIAGLDAGLREHGADLLGALQLDVGGRERIERHIDRAGDVAGLVGCGSADYAGLSNAAGQPENGRMFDRMISIL